MKTYISLPALFLLIMIVIGCDYSQNKNTHAPHNAQLNSRYVGYWESVQHNASEVIEWKNVSKCFLIITKSEIDTGAYNTSSFPVKSLPLKVKMTLENKSGNRYPLPDSNPSYITYDNEMVFGPIGSAYIFEVNVQGDFLYLKSKFINIKFKKVNNR